MVESQASFTLLLKMLCLILTSKKNNFSMVWLPLARKGPPGIHSVASELFARYVVRLVTCGYSFMSIDRLQLKLRTIMGRFQLPKLLPLGMLTSALASKVNTSPVTKIFHFKEDFFLKFYPLPHAIGPDNVNVLMSALNDYAPRFKDVWIREIEANLQGGSCKVEVRGL